MELINWIWKWLKIIRAFFKGPQFSKREVVRYAGCLRRISRVGFSTATIEWRYQLGGETCIDFSGAQIMEMKTDFIRYQKMKII
jgi:hypothetical protein